MAELNAPLLQDLEPAHVQQRSTGLAHGAHESTCWPTLCEAALSQASLWLLFRRFLVLSCCGHKVRRLLDHLLQHICLYIHVLTGTRLWLRFTLLELLLQPSWALTRKASSEKGDMYSPSKSLFNAGKRHHVDVHMQTSAYTPQCPTSAVT